MAPSFSLSVLAFSSTLLLNDVTGVTVDKLVRSESESHKVISVAANGAHARGLDLQDPPPTDAINDGTTAGGTTGDATAAGTTADATGDATVAGTTADATGAGVTIAAENAAAASGEGEGVDVDAGTCPDDADYPVAAEDTPCTCPTGTEMIISPEDCKLAADYAGLTVTATHQNEQTFLTSNIAAAGKETGTKADGTSYTIGAGNNREYFPKGCHKVSCSDDPTGVCYHFNPIDVIPAGCSGATVTNGLTRRETPHILAGSASVCKRKKYKEGIRNTNGDDSTAGKGCGADYGPVLSQENCSTIATCWGLPHHNELSTGQCGEMFIVTDANQSRYDEFPIGCFKNADPSPVPELVAGCVYYNPPLENWAPPARPKGVPLCNVTVRTWYNVKDDSSGEGEE